MIVYQEIRPSGVSGTKRAGQRVKWRQFALSVLKGTAPGAESVVTLGRLPVRVVPVHGEAIDSWLDAIASSMDLPLGALARVLDLPTAGRPFWLVWALSR